MYKQRPEMLLKSCTAQDAPTNRIIQPQNVNSEIEKLCSKAKNPASQSALHAYTGLSRHLSSPLTYS